MSVSFFLSGCACLLPLTPISPAVWWSAHSPTQPARNCCTEHSQLRWRHKLLGRQQRRWCKFLVMLLIIWSASLLCDCYKYFIPFFLQTFAAPSFDDKILEVVAVFGSMQMAVSRVIKLQHHRIAQVTLNWHCYMDICFLFTICSQYVDSELVPDLIRFTAVLIVCRVCFYKYSWMCWRRAGAGQSGHCVLRILKHQSTL